MKIKKILSAALAAVLSLASLSVPVSADSGISAEVSLSGVSVGNICSQAEDVVVNITTSNREAYAVYGITTSITVTNNTLGSTVWTNTDTFDINANARSVKSYTPVFGTRGYGDLTLSISVKNGSVSIYENSYSLTRVKQPSALNYSLGYSVNHGFVYKAPAWTNETAEIIINAAQKTGVGYIRDGIEWIVIEPSKGSRAMPAGSVEFYRQLKNAGIKVIFVLAYGNPLYGGAATHFPNTDAQRTAFANYCQYIAQQLNGIVYDYELWNEPDLDYANADGAGGAEYAALAKAVYPKLKAVNSSNKLVSFATASVNSTFWSQAINAGVLNYTDAVSYHTYFSGSPESAFYDVSSNARGYTTKPIWMTATGYTTYSYSEAEQAANVAKLQAVRKDDGKISTMFYYSLMDRASGVTGGELYFGQLRSDGTAKPGFAAAAFANSVLGTASAAGRSSDKKTEGSIFNRKTYYIYDYRFTGTAGEQIAVAFTSGNSYSKTYSFTAQPGYKLRVYDMYGNLESTGGSSSTSITVTTVPKYLIYAPESASEPEPVEEPVVPDCKIDVTDGGIINISGTSADKYVSVMAFESGKTIRESVVMDQLTVDENHHFETSFKLPDDKLYLIKVSEKMTLKQLAAAPGVGVLFDFYANGNKVGSLADIDLTSTAAFGSNASVLYKYSTYEDFDHAFDWSTKADKTGWDFAWTSGPVDYNGEKVQVIGADGWTTLEYYGDIVSSGKWTAMVDVCFDTGYGNAAIPSADCDLADIKFGSGNNENSRGGYFRYNASDGTISVACQDHWQNFITGLELGKWYTLRLDADLDSDTCTVSVRDRRSGRLLGSYNTNFIDNVSYAYLQGLCNRLTMIDNLITFKDNSDNSVIGFAAVYNGERLISTSTDSGSVISFDGIDVSNADKLKLMLWEDLNTLRPYISAVTVR